MPRTGVCRLWIFNRRRGLRVDIVGTTRCFSDAMSRERVSDTLSTPENGRFVRTPPPLLSLLYVYEGILYIYIFFFFILSLHTIAVKFKWKPVSVFSSPPREHLLSRPITTIKDFKPSGVPTDEIIHAYGLFYLFSPTECYGVVYSVHGVYICICARRIRNVREKEAKCTTRVCFYECFYDKRRNKSDAGNLIQLLAMCRTRRIIEKSKPLWATRFALFGQIAKISRNGKVDVTRVK